MGLSFDTQRYLLVCEWVFTKYSLWSRNLNKIADGIGGKFGRLLSCVITFIGGYVIGFMYCWQMTLVMLAALPFMAICGVMMGLVRTTAL